MTRHSLRPVPGRLRGRICLAFAGLTLVACIGPTPEPQPPPTQTEPKDAPPPEEPPPPPPAKQVIAVFDIRSVDTEQAPRSKVVDLSEQIRQRLRRSGRFEIVSPDAGADGANDCKDEACQLPTATELGAEHALHTRLIQYDDNCVLTGVVFEAALAHSTWAFTERFSCNPTNLETAVGNLTSDLLAGIELVAGETVHAVIPVQHKLRSLDWASESLTEYLSSMLAAAKRTIVPSSTLGGPLNETNKPRSRACGSKSCALGVGETIDAGRAVATSISKRGRKCTVESKIYDVKTKTSSISAKASSSCEARDLAGALESVTADLLSGL